MIRTSMFATTVALSLALSAPLFAHDAPCMAEAPHDVVDVTIGAFTFSEGFTRATMENAPTAGGYVTITNAGDEDDRLIGVSSPLAEAMEIHEMAVVNDIMQMRELDEGLDIPAGESVALAPGGLHLMFFRIEGQFVEGESVPVTLVFENAGEVEIELAVGGFAATGAPGHAH